MGYTKDNPVDPTRSRRLAAHYLRRKERAIAFLGGTCVRCGETEGLEFDHIDPDRKSFGITENLTRRWDVVESELKKCQLLCRIHHLDKTYAAVV